MTTPAMASNPKKLSFAKVAAAPVSKQLPHVPTLQRRPPAQVSHKDQENMPPPSSTAVLSTELPGAPAANGASAPARLNASGVMLEAGTAPSAERPQDDRSKLAAGLKDLKLQTSPPSLVINSEDLIAAERSSKNGMNSQTPSDDNSQRADSNSEVGTKPPSLDGKSITSGTTFAMDEKESLRPDDSASVMAATEDDDAFSIRGSLVAGSRNSELAARFHRLQLGDMPPRAIPSQVPFAHQIQGVVTPQSGISDKQPVIEAKLPLESAATPDNLSTSGFYSQNPDEKLLEAMKSPKDRLFLLKLEQQVINFVQDSKEPFMDLPPSNSFCRMLTHKLADYYHMTHSFEAVASSVRIYRTPFCRIPPALSSIEVVTSQSSSPTPAVLPKKIMRRGEVGEFGSASAGASKPTSEDGSDGKDKGRLAKEKLTREEREEAYNRARERIFGTAEKTETPPGDGDDSNGVSRASSVSAKASNLGTKRKPGKQRREDSESWDSRSNYIAWGTTQNATWAPMPSSNQEYFPAANSQFGGQFQQVYGNAVQPVFGSGQPYTQGMTNTAFVQPYAAMPAYAPQPVPQPPPQQQPQQQQLQPLPPQQRYPPPNPAMTAPYGAPMQSVPQQAWPQPSYSQQQTYTQPPPQTYNQTQSPAQYPPRSSPVPGGVPYAYGQLPVNVNAKDPKSQHPIPGSYNRHVGSFNPKSTSFVPGPSGASMAPMLGHGPSPSVYAGSGTGSPQLNSQHMNYSGFQQPIPIPQQFAPGMAPQPGYGGNPSGYGMARQGSNNSLPPYHAVQNPQAPSLAAQGLSPNPSPSNHIHHHNNSTLVQGGSHPQTFSHLPNYGNPATLPQKPSI